MEQPSLAVHRSNSEGINPSGRAIAPPFPWIEKTAWFFLRLWTAAKFYQISVLWQCQGEPTVNYFLTSILQAHKIAVDKLKKERENIQR